MKPKVLFSLVAALVVLGLIALLIDRSGEGSRPETAELRGTRLLEGWPINDVKSIEVQSPEEAVTLTKNDNRWVVAQRDGYAADPARVQGLLVKLWETPVIQALEAGPSQNQRLNLVDPAAEGEAEDKATKVTFKGANDAVIGHVLIGKDVSPDAPAMDMGAAGGGKTGRFVRTSKEEDVVLEVANNFSETLSSGWPYSFSAIEAEPGSWLNKTDFINVSKVQTIEVSYQDSEKEGFALTRESDTGDFTLEGEIPAGKELDGSKVSSLKTILQSASFEDLLTKEEVEALDETKTAQAVIRTFDGFTYTLTLGEKDETDNQIPVKFVVSGEFAQAREVPEGTEETEEEKTKADQEFADALKVNEEKLAKEKALEGHWFTLSSYRVDALLKSRPELLKDEETEAETTADGSPAGGAPPSSIAKPGVVELPPGISSQTSGALEAVSPPVAVPPLNGGESATTPPIAIPPAPPATEPQAAATDDQSEVDAGDASEEVETAPVEDAAPPKTEALEAPETETETSAEAPETETETSVEAPAVETDESAQADDEVVESPAQQEQAVEAEAAEDTPPSGN